MSRRAYVINNETEKRELIERMNRAPVTRPWRIVVDFDDDRTTKQNALLRVLLSAVSRQVEWHGQKLSEESWKDIFTAALKGQNGVPGLDGGLVFLGARTSRMNKAEMSELIELVQAFMADNGVEA